MTRILITGASGFTGRHACARFAASGWEVVAVTSGRSGDATEAEAASPPAAGPGGAVEWRRCDLTDREQVRRLCLETSPHALLHLAGQNAVDRSWQDPVQTVSANAMATMHLLEAMRENGGDGRMLVVGSMLGSLSGGTAHPYAFSKKLQVTSALAWHRWYGLQVLVAEPSNLVGPGRSGGLCGKLARWTAEAERSGGIFSPARVRPFRLSSLREQRDYLDVRDAVDAYETLLRAGEAGSTYALESGRMRSIGEIKEQFERLSGVRLDWEIGDADSPSPEPRDATAIRALGWQPRIPFERSLSEALEEERAIAGRRKGTAG
ncbi:SDR family NAD(P)-dependent oxidoreductase [Cohnella sp. CBP 2801]|uniref:SDR family NAD(P)-dependent oxidoreductase n=2 Tax=Cohnella zeiphila TaxID=2761120 RepID=A0A7X0VY45_9BACL|nr:SDR family NAD(P)-dependent oxidoreductase [Cohnella zeiphila]